MTKSEHEKERRADDVSDEETERDLRIRVLRYEIETEEFDRTLPGRWFRDSGEWMPNAESMPISRNNASRVMGELRLTQADIIAHSDKRRHRFSLDRLRDELSAMLHGESDKRFPEPEESEEK